MAKGPAQIEPLLRRLQDDETVPALARALFAEQAADYARLQARIEATDARLLEWHRANPMSQRLTRVPGIGPVIASLLVMKTPDPKAFRSGRDYAAPPSQGQAMARADAERPLHRRQSQAGRDHARRRRDLAKPAGGRRHRGRLADRRGAGRHPMPWLIKLMDRKPAKLAAVALANKIARVVWKLMTSGESYDPARTRPTPVVSAIPAAA